MSVLSNLLNKGSKYLGASTTGQAFGMTGSTIFSKKPSGFLSNEWISDKWDRFTGKKQEDMIKEQNRKQEEFQNRMYQQQRQDALADWFRTNAYNSPEQQMNRLRQAGLSPNLAYGNLADGAAGMVRSSNPDSLQQQQVPMANPLKAINEIGGGISNGILEYQNIKARRSQIENINQDTENKKVQNIGMLFNNVNKEIKNEKDKETLSILKATKEDLIKAANKRATLMEGDIQLKAQELGFNQAIQPLKEALMKNGIELSKQQIEGLKSDNTIKSYDATLVDDLGLSRTSAAWLKIMMDAIGGSAKFGRQVSKDRAMKKGKIPSWPSPKWK